jgi:hypothetical protein
MKALTLAIVGLTGLLLGGCCTRTTVTTTGTVRPVMEQPVLETEDTVTTTTTIAPVK